MVSNTMLSELGPMDMDHNHLCLSVHPSVHLYLCLLPFIPPLPPSSFFPPPLSLSLTPDPSSSHHPPPSLTHTHVFSDVQAWIFLLCILLLGAEALGFLQHLKRSLQISYRCFLELACMRALSEDHQLLSLLPLGSPSHFP